MLLDDFSLEITGKDAHGLAAARIPLTARIPARLRCPGPDISLFV